VEPNSDHEKERIEQLRRAMYSREMSEKLKERPRRPLEDVRPVVGEEWHRQEGNLSPTIVAPKTIALARRALWWLLAIAVIFFVAAIGFFAYYFLIGSGSSSASTGNIDISISGPPQIAGGDPTQLQIVVTNRNRVPLQLAELVVTYPEGTRSPTDLSSDLDSQRIPLGTIEAGGRRQGTVSAIFASNNADADIKVDLEYRIAGSSAIFVAHSGYQAILSSSPVSIRVEGNTETISGQNVEITVVVSSNSNTVVKDVLVSASYPFGFSVRSANPKADESGNLWLLGDIAPGQKKEIVVRGVLTGESGDERVFRFTSGTRKTQSEKNITTVLAESSHLMQVSEPFLGLSLSVNKASGQSAVVAPGETVNVVVNWRNNLSTEIKDAVIVAKLSGIAIDGSTFASTDGFYRSTDGVVLWDKTTTNGALSSISPGASGNVAFSFKVPSGTALENIRDPYVTLAINASGKRVSESGVPENLQATASQKVAVASDLRVTAQGLYYANPFRSVGPLPPKAEVETTYAIVFTVTNSTNKITDAKLTATLPAYVRWAGIYSPGSESVTFNQVDSTVTWDLDTVEPRVGLSGIPPRQAAIAIGFTPSTSQIGEEPILIQDISLTAKDSATGKTITQNLKDVTTNIVGDPGFTATNATVVR
jgi:hypothetical protein